MLVVLCLTPFGSRNKVNQRKISEAGSHEAARPCGTGNNIASYMMQAAAVTRVTYRGRPRPAATPRGGHCQQKAQSTP